MAIKLYHDINGKLVKAVGYTYFPAVKKNPPIPGSIRSQQESRRRAFALASLKIAQNPDMNVFITLTYDPKRNPSPHYLDDLKNFFRGTHAKYLATFERHTNNPCLHIHLITNYNFPTFTNPNGFPSLSGWHKGFSSVKYLEDTDDRFNASKYVFKYMNKSEKISHKFVYSSRGLLIPPEELPYEFSSTDQHWNDFLISTYFGSLQIRTFDVTSNYTIIIGG